MRRWLTRPGRYADTDRYAYLAPDGFLGYRWQHGNDAIFVERVVASSAATTRALWAVAASNSTVAGTVRAQVGPSDPLWWMLREQDADIAERESWMLRLLDAPAAIAARGFPATDLDRAAADHRRPAAGQLGPVGPDGPGRRRPPFQVPNGRSFPFPRSVRRTPGARRSRWVPVASPRCTRGRRSRPCAGPGCRWRRPGC
jgi:hypothetical protein